MQRRTLTADLLAALCFLAVAAAAAGEQPDRVVIPRTATPPTLDGKLDDPCWAHPGPAPPAAILTGLTRPNSTDVVRKSVEVRLCCDAQALYIGVTCAEPEPGKIKAQARLRNEGVWTDDCVEVWLRSGSNTLDFDQFVVNSIGTQEELHRRNGANMQTLGSSWQAKAVRGPASWTVEVRIPAGDVGWDEFRRGDMLGLKIGREDYTAGAQEAELSTWPPGSSYAGTEGYGLCFIEDPNVVAGPALQDRKHWRAKKGDESFFVAGEDAGAPVIRINSPNRYCTLNQELQLRPDSLYCLAADVKASGRMYIRVRALQADQKKGDTGKPFDLRIEQSKDYVSAATRFTTGPDGQALLIVGTTEASGAGQFFIRNLSVARTVAPESTGRAIPITAGAEPLVVTKLRVTDCRALRGFIGAPVDGSLKSGQWDGGTWEYNMPSAGAGVGYAYHNNDGLHITFADDAGFNAVVVRGGIKAKLYRDCAKYDDPASGTLIHEFPGQTQNSRAFFDQPVKTSRVSFFDVTDGLITDCSFYRVHARAPGTHAVNVHQWCVEKSTAKSAAPLSDAVRRQLESRFAADERTVWSCAAGAPFARDEAKLDVTPCKCVHLVTTPTEKEFPVAAIRFGCRVTGPDGRIPFSLAIQDPLNPRLELHGADYELDKAGVLQVVCDFADQIIPARTQLWVTLRFDVPVTLEYPGIYLQYVPREQALPEALAYRKFLLKSFYCVMSEARPWNAFHKPDDITEFFQKKNNPYAPWVREIMDTLDQCRALDPEGNDDTVRQYYEWLYRGILRKSKEGMPPYPTRFDAIAGVPEWAVLAHQAWMQCREVARWWIENRMTPNGELGGEVGDDTDMFGNWASFPAFERDGVGGLCLDGGARLADTAERSTLEQGLNRRTMDPLHAYEEGLNHEAQMLWWFYGDPLYTERCMVAARSTEALTTVTPKGHRHFKSQDCGAADLRMERKLGSDGSTHPLMWHPTLESAWYNRNPKALKMLTEWAGGWLDHMQPGKYATLVNVATETVEESAETPLYGGYGSQACVHTFISDLTGDARYVQPLLAYFAAGKHDQYSRRHLPELMQMGMFTVPEDKCREAISRTWQAELILRGNKAPLIAALKNDVEELQRFRHMYTTVECFTDRVFLYALINPTIAYTGGFATRNKLNHNFAVTWEGLGTDYAALVTSATATHLNLLLCSLSDKPLQGRMRVWRLEHGDYELTFGPDADGDDKADRAERTEKLELARAAEIPVSLPKKGVYVLELKQTRKLDDIFARADLALSRTELKVQGGKVTGRAHNLGSRDVPDAVVALLDDKGQVVARKSLGKIAAPLDLTPQAVPFELEGVPAGAKGWAVVLDPEGHVPEIYKGNNRVLLGE
ncbi:MAG: hypothetical protein NTW87_27985 [Planctomycetota bacterium]|nr:hypothetical protein [Planctomycetota bacterium]